MTLTSIQDAAIARMKASRRNNQTVARRILKRDLGKLGYTDSQCTDAWNEALDVYVLDVTSA